MKLKIKHNQIPLKSLQCELLFESFHNKIYESLNSNLFWLLFNKSFIKSIYPILKIIYENDKCVVYKVKLDQM